MSKGLPRSNGRGAPARSTIRKHQIRVNKLAITTSGATGVGFGTAVLGDLPQGNILLLGAMAYLQFTKDSAGTIATFDGDFSIGSAPTADATLNGSEVDIIPSTALGAATASVSPVVRGSNATQVMLDNTDDSLELNLNLLMDDASVSADAQAFTVDGVVELCYAVMLDD
jgi:hypothetical protein